MKTTQRKGGRKKGPRSRRAAVRAFADEQSAGDLVVSSAYARSGVLLLRRSAEHGGPLYRVIGRGLLQHDISCCCLLGSTSFGAGRSAMSTALASFLFGMLFAVQRLFAKRVNAPPGPCGHPPPVKKDRSPQGLTSFVQGLPPPGSSGGAPALAPPRGASRAYATHILAAQGLKTHVSSN